MAKVDFKMPEEFLTQISRLGSRFDSVAESVLEAGGEVVLAKVKELLSTYDAILAPACSKLSFESYFS